MKYRDMEYLKTALQARSHLMTSKECDLGALTWTFSAPSFRAGAGEYLVISIKDWDAVWEGEQ